MKGTLPLPRFGIIALRGRGWAANTSLHWASPFYFGLTRKVGAHAAPRMNSSAEVDAPSADKVRKIGGEVDATAGATSSVFLRMDSHEITAVGAHSERLE